MSDGKKLDPELLGPLSKASHQELERIVEYLDASPVILIKKKEGYKKNKSDLTKAYELITETILAAGGYGVLDFNVYKASYKDIVFGAVPDNYCEWSFTHCFRFFKRVAGVPLLNRHSHSLRKRWKLALGMPL